MQWVVSTLLISAVIVGVFALYLRTPPSAEEPSIVKQIFQRTGISAEQDNRKSMQKFSVTVESGMAIVREQIMLVKEKNEHLKDYINEQKSNLKLKGKNLEDIMEELKSKKLSSVELTRLKTVADALENQSRILISDGEELTRMNERIHDDMDAMKARMEVLRMKSGSEEREEGALFERLEAMAGKQADVLQRAQDLNERSAQLSLAMKEKLMDKVVVPEISIPAPQRESTAASGARLSDIQQKIDGFNIKAQQNSENSRQKSIEQSQRAAESADTQLKERMDDLVNDNSGVLEKIAEAKERVAQLMAQAKERAEDNAEKAKEKAEENKEKIDNAREQAEARKEALAEKRERLADKNQ